MDTTQKQFLTAKARQLRDDVIETIGRFGSGHIGGAMSVMDALTVIYYAKANVDPKNPKKFDRDRIVMSKGHAGPAMYAVLADKGYFPKEWLKTLNQNGTNLPSHCDMNKTPGIDMTAGRSDKVFRVRSVWLLRQKRIIIPPPYIALSVTAKARKVRFGKRVCLQALTALTI